MIRSLLAAVTFEVVYWANPGLEFILVGGAMMILAATQAVVSACFLVRLWRRQSPEHSKSSFAPKAAVLLPLRGTDPTLEETLHGLLDQNYPNFSITIALDSSDDPVRQVVEKVIEESRSTVIDILILTDCKSTCSLKCGAIAESIRQLKDDVEVIAFIDADAPPHQNWLRDLVAPLEDESVGVVTGNRWFVPRDGRWGTVTRYLWNAAAVVQVWLNRIVWAGSMAMRGELARDSELLVAWERALSVDATVTRLVKSRGLEVHFAPTVMIPNRESIGLSQFKIWVERQLVAAKSSGSGWFLVSLHTFSVIVIQLTAILLLLIALISGEPIAVAWVGIGLVAYWFSNFLALALMEKTVRQILRDNGVEVFPFSKQVLFRFFPAMIVSLITYGAAFLSSIFSQRIEWRGIEYVISGENEVRMMNYHPFVNSGQNEPKDSVL